MVSNEWLGIGEIIKACVEKRGVHANADVVAYVLACVQACVRAKIRIAALPVDEDVDAVARLVTTTVRAPVRRITQKRRAAVAAASSPTRIARKEPPSSPVVAHEKPLLVSTKIVCKTPTKLPTDIHVAQMTAELRNGDTAKLFADVVRFDAKAVELAFIFTRPTKTSARFELLTAAAAAGRNGSSNLANTVARWDFEEKYCDEQHLFPRMRLAIGYATIHGTLKRYAGGASIYEKIATIVGGTCTADRVHNMLGFGWFCVKSPLAVRVLERGDVIRQPIFRQIRDWCSRKRAASVLPFLEARWREMRPFEPCTASAFEIVSHWVITPTTTRRSAPS